MKDIGKIRVIRCDGFCNVLVLNGVESKCHDAVSINYNEYGDYISKQCSLNR